MIPLHTPTHRRDCAPDWTNLAKCDLSDGMDCPWHSPGAYAEHAARHKAVTL